MDSNVKNKTIHSWAKEHCKKIFPMCLAIFLFTGAIWDFETFRLIFLCDDEFGYFATSAFLRGLDWSQIACGIPYYSYGYGMFVLTPISLLFQTPAGMYQAAIVVNGFMLVASYGIARSVAKQVFPDMSWLKRDIICFLIMLYPSNFVYSHIALSECTLVFIFWLYLWISLTALKNPTHKKYIAWGVITMLLYIVHQRTLGILSATILVLALTYFVSKERKKYIISFIVTFVSIYCFHHVFKDYYQEVLYLGSEALQKNDIVGQIENVSKAFSLSGLGKVIQSFIGKWFYLMISTGFMIWWAVLTLFQQVWSGIKAKYIDELNMFDYKSVWHTLILLSFIFNFMICVLVNLDIDKYDNLVYGRYNDNILGIYLLYGIYYFLKQGKWKIKFIIGVLLVIIAAFVCQIVLNQADTNIYQYYHSVGTGTVLKDAVSPEGRMLWYGAGGLIIVAIATVLVKGPRWKQFDYVRKWILVLLPTIVWLHISGTLVMNYMTEVQRYNAEDMTPVAEIIDGLDLDETIYFACEPDERRWSELFQFLLQDEPIKITNVIDYTTKEVAYYIVSDTFWKRETAKEHFVTLYQGQQFSLIVIKKDDSMRNITGLAE